MKTTTPRVRKAGYVSILLVLSTGAILSILTIYAYRRAIQAQSVQSQVQLRVDYSEKEEAILRSIVAIAPNRAIQAMQAGSDTTAKRDALRWQDIFTESLVLANARTSISGNLVTKLGITGLKTSNTGDSALTVPADIFKPVVTGTGFVSVGINRSLGTGYPVPLTSTDATINSRDLLYPIISDKKSYGTLAQSGVNLPVGTYSNFNLIPYPKINFGYTKPGEAFVAKRNWWAFSVDVADADDNRTFLPHNKRDFVLSIYEVPSQLPISAASFMSFGEYSSGAAWQNVNIDGGFFAGRAEVKGDGSYSTVASRRGMTIDSQTKVGGDRVPDNPFAAGKRENYQADGTKILPVSLSSESGRAAFIPINRGKAFFDRFSATENDPIDAAGARNHVATNVLSNLSWNNYSIGAQQCAMRLDITRVQGGAPVNRTPTELRFQYYRTDGTRGEDVMPFVDRGTMNTLPRGYVRVCAENETYVFDTEVDVAYGDPKAGGGYSFKRGVTGSVTFSNAVFGDPNVGEVKSGYWRPKCPLVKKEIGSKWCVVVSPERIPAYLASLGDAAPIGPATVVGPFGNSGPNPTGVPFYNNSISVNVDYSRIGAGFPTEPNIPCTEMDYGVVLQECANLTAYTRGFSLVTNLRLYIGGDFNKITTTPPAGYTPAITSANPGGSYWPPCSLFSPEKRYGAELSPYSVNLRGQVGSVSKIDKVNTSDAEAVKVRPLDSKFGTGAAIAAENIVVNLSQIRHPAELPPITMMNWLILLEERRRDHY